MKKFNERVSSEILLKHLRKSFLQLEPLFSRWQDDNKTAEKRIESIVNLMEQLKACERVKSGDLSENLYEVKPLLMLKIRSSLEDDIDELKKDLLPLDQCCSAAEKIYEESRQIYDESSIDVCQATEATATRTSISDMLEYLDRFQRYFREEYHGKLFFVENVVFSCSAMTIKELKEHWNRRNLQTHLVQNIWPYLDDFLKED